MRMIDVMRSSFLPYRFALLRRAFVLLLAALFPLGCSDTANGTRAEPQMPKVGSVYSMAVTQSVLGIDSPAQRTLDVTLRVSDMIFEGKEHVAQFAADTMISLIAYEPNGDLSIYLRRERIGPCIVDAQWLRLPFRGTDSVSDMLQCLPFPDSVRAGRGKNPVARWTARPAGTERITVQGKEMQVMKVEAQLAIYADSAAAGPPLQSREYVLWYAPELGYTVRERLVSLVHSHEADSADRGADTSAKGAGRRADTLGTSHRELIGYVLK